LSEGRSNRFFVRAARWIASAFAKASADKSLSLSSGAHSRDPLARDARELLESSGLKPTPRRVALSGIADKVSVYEIS
jgi:hypothetical protein